jgi:hypothetical protein
VVCARLDQLIITRQGVGKRAPSAQRKLGSFGAARGDIGEQFGTRKVHVAERFGAALGILNNAQAMWRFLRSFPAPPNTAEMQLFTGKCRGAMRRLRKAEIWCRRSARLVRRAHKPHVSPSKVAA